MDNLKSKAQVSYDTHNEEVIVRRKRRKIMGPFSAIGKLSDTQSDREDIFDLLGQVSKNAFLLFNQFKKNRDQNNNLVRHSLAGQTKTQKETFSRNLRELRRQDIVRVAARQMIGKDPIRPYVTPKHTYMINPELLKCWAYEDAELLWDQCKM